MNYIEFFNKDNKSGWKSVERKLKNKEPEVYNCVVDFITNYPKLSVLPFKQQIWHFSNNSEDLIYCKECGNQSKYLDFNRGYQEFCSNKCSNKNKDKIQRVKDSTFEHYGVTSPLQSKEIKIKVRETNNKIYGVENVFQSAEIKNKIKKTNILTYGYSSPFKSPDFLMTLKPNWTSKAEKEIGDFINSLGIIFEDNDRKFLHGNEIDILIHDKKIGIEFNGNRYHTEIYGNKNNTYHLNKTKLMNENGYGLIHIFEDEWENKKDIVKSKLKHILGCSNGIKIGGRQCEIKEISTTEKNDFLNKFHIQGEDKSTLKLGAFYKNILVSVMCFNNKRNMSSDMNGGWELTRFATNNDYIIMGIASKMLKFFIKKYSPNEIISFADKRWTINENNLYSKLGFLKDGDVRPNYFYYHANNKYKRFHKFNFGISSLKKKGMWDVAVADLISKGGTEKDMTEWKCMQFHGWDRIWDCGLIRYKLVISSQN